MLRNKIMSAIESLENQAKRNYLPYANYGIRFDRRNLNEGISLGNSKSNIDRLNVREYPTFGTPEYEDMEELNGTCAYDLFDGDSEKRYFRLESLLETIDKDEELGFEKVNWYLIAGDSLEEGEDEHEVIISDAVVVCKLL